MSESICPTMSEWRIIDANYDGEPRKAAVCAYSCRQCPNFDDCVAKVRFAHTMDQLCSALSLME